MTRAFFALPKKARHQPGLFLFPVTSATAAALLMGVGLVFASAKVSADYQEGVQFFAKKEYKNAYDELLPSAQAGHAVAQFIIGAMYQDGIYVAKDRKAAVEWYRRASEQGHPDAQFFLASMLLRGTGASPDLEAAYQWACLAADRRGPNQEKAAALCNDLAARIGEVQLARAKSAAAAWRPRIEMADGRSADLRRPLWTGTGFFLNASGTFLTNQHVAYRCPRIVISYGDKTVDGLLLDVDFGADLATVQTNLTPSGVARFAGEARPDVGAPVSVIGYAINRTVSPRALTSSGAVVNAGTARGNAAWFQTSVPIYRGQSGSPMLDATGQVVGVARGVPGGQPNDPSQADGPAEAVGADSTFRFLARTKTPFEKASPGSAAPTPDSASPSDFIVFVRCLSN